MILDLCLSVPIPVSGERGGLIDYDDCPISLWACGSARDVSPQDQPQVPASQVRDGREVEKLYWNEYITNMYAIDYLVLLSQLFPW